MHIIINNASLIPIYEQIQDQIKGNILNNILKENDPLPSVRNLASELCISALTVKKAYDALEKDGYVVTIHGKGTYVAKTNQEMAKEVRRKDIETELYNLLMKARNLGLSDDEIKEMFYLMLEE